MNKEKEGEIIKFTCRITRENHRWLKKMSNYTKGSEKFLSMNDFIQDAIDEYREKIERS